MTRRHDVGKRIATLREIDEILTAMKNLSLVEVRRIEGFIEAQRAALAVIEDAAADFLLDYGETIRPGPSGNDVLCIIGSERGFCGDFNARVAEEAVRWQGGRPAPAAVLLVGERLVGAWGGEVTAAIPGASVADEVPQAVDVVDHVDQDRPAAGFPAPRRCDWTAVISTPRAGSTMASSPILATH